MEIVAGVGLTRSRALLVAYIDSILGNFDNENTTFSSRICDAPLPLYLRVCSLDISAGTWQDTAALA